MADVLGPVLGACVSLIATYMFTFSPWNNGIMSHRIMILKGFLKPTNPYFLSSFGEELNYPPPNFR